MNIKEERDSIIKDLSLWSKENTKIEEIMAKDVLKFFELQGEEIIQDLIYVANIQEKIIEQGKLKYNIGKYIGKEYANEILLNILKNEDVTKIKEEISEKSKNFVKIELGNTSKISKLQKFLSEQITLSKKDSISKEEICKKFCTQENISTENFEEILKKAEKISAIKKMKNGDLTL